MNIGLYTTTNLTLESMAILLDFGLDVFITVLSMKIKKFKLTEKMSKKLMKKKKVKKRKITF